MLTPPDTLPSPPTSLSRPTRLLITAGPTQEPIDAVRYIGNRSSGRLGVAIADEAAGRDWTVTLLLGPSALLPKSSQIRVIRFRTTSDLEGLLRTHLPDSDILIMAAAVADYRPKAAAVSTSKLRRTAKGLTLELESTPDLLAACSKARRPGQTLVGFALEPADTMVRSAEEKLKRKGVDMIVANALETMDAPTINATVVGASGVLARTPGTLSKEAFAPWLLDVIAAQAGAHRS